MKPKWIEKDYISKNLARVFQTKFFFPPQTFLSSTQKSTRWHFRLLVANVIAATQNMILTVYCAFTPAAATANDPLDSIWLHKSIGW